MMIDWSKVQDWFSSNWASILIGIVVSWYFYVKGDNKRKPCFIIDSYTVIKNAISMSPGLTVHFAGHGADLPNFTISRIALWNAGRETIRKEDVPKIEPVRIVALAEAKILSAEIIFYSSDVNQFSHSICKEKSTLSILFDHIERNEGVVIQIGHSGIGSKALELRGKIKGAETIRNIGQIRLVEALLPSKTVARRIRATIPFFMFGMGGACVLFVFAPDSLLVSSPTYSRVASVANALIFFAMAFATSKKTSIPKAIAVALDKPWGTDAH